MLSWQVDGYADVNHILAEVRAGQPVLAELGPLRGNRVDRGVKANLLDELVRLAAIDGAHVQELNRVRIHKIGRKRALGRCVVFPRTGGPGSRDAGVREPRRPTPGTDLMSAAVEPADRQRE